MGKLIICGRINKYYGYIILPTIFLLLQDIAFGANYNNSFHDTKLFGTSKKYNTIHFLYCYIFIFLASFIFFFKCKDKEKKSENLLSKKTEKVEEKKGQNNTKHSFLKFLIIIMLWVIEEQLKDLYFNTLKNLDFWMFELIIIYLFNKKTFNTELYKHQKFSFIIMIFPFIFKIGTITLSCISKDKTDPIFIYTNYIIVFPIGILLYIFLIILDSYILTKIKWYMDIKYISITEILMYFGLFGTILYIIISVISLFRVCPKILVNNICIQGNDNETFFEFENFNFYYDELKGNPTTIIKEIIVSLIGSFAFLFEYIFYLLIVKNLSPIHKIFSVPLFFFFQKAFMAINTLCREQKFFVDNSYEYILWKFILDTTGDIFSIFALMIFLEIIELNFCDFNYNTRRTISVRAMSDQFDIGKEKKFVINLFEF